eukprot:TRINITY_DN15154_c0_g2_i1.p1 TRINITY_DN15154_c0_g2~~TRINITY_DN15154_c0_g2_i1.p1  ORF type:complete len:178 (-),score=24.02 TRINITY_DN15154_c0_g2_i1:323-856(-)
MGKEPVRFQSHYKRTTRHNHVTEKLPRNELAGEKLEYERVKSMIQNEYEILNNLLVEYDIHLQPTRYKEKRIKTERQMKELYKELQELKSNRFAYTVRANEGKLIELKAVVEVARERLEDQKRTHKEEVGKMQKEQRLVCEKYTEVIQSQAAKINNYNISIKKYKQNINSLKVSYLS